MAEKKSLGKAIMIGAGAAAAAAAAFGVVLYRQIKRDLRQEAEEYLNEDEPDGIIIRDESGASAEAVGYDTTGDGKVDTICVDTNGDGAVDTILTDTTGDGTPDTAVIDTDHDGKFDTVVTLPQDEAEEKPAEE